MNNKQRLIFISDTHSKHSQMDKDIKAIPNLEDSILIHAGDISSMGYMHEVENFLTWYNSLNAKYKVMILGNHEVYFEKIGEEERRKTLAKYPSIIYLENSGVEIEGIKFWGSPQQPEFYDWAFNVPRGAAIKKYWDLIPDDTNILITHGPAKDYGDLVNNKYQYQQNVGCEDLLNRINELPNLTHFVCGHIHSGHGVQQHNNVKMINASLLDEDYRYSYNPIVMKI